MEVRLVESRGRAVLTPRQGKEAMPISLTEPLAIRIMDTPVKAMLDA